MKKEYATTRLVQVLKRLFGMATCAAHGGGGTCLNAPDKFLKGCKSLNICYDSDMLYHITPKVCFKEKSAFTLAEVLITLGIIGVAAALTMPSLLSNIQDKQYKSAYKKVYSAFSQALERMKAEEELLDIKNVSSEGFGASPNVGENFKTISKYFNNAKICFDENANECWVCAEGEAGYINNGAPDWLGCNKQNYSFVDASGTAWYLYSNIEYPILVDVNGNKKPNKLGKDRFVIRFASGNSDGIYVDRIDKIMPVADYTSKQRWCPSGSCQNTSWLLD